MSAPLGACIIGVAHHWQSHRPEASPEDVVAACASFGLVVDSQRELDSYDDRNFVVTGTVAGTEAPAQAVLKVSHCTTPEQRARLLLQVG